jgi:hypothetical protein
MMENLPRTRSYKKDNEPLLNLKGAMSRCSREEGAYVYLMNKTADRRKMFITRANAAS